jgi:hypothetical protein
MAKYQSKRNIYAHRRISVGEIIDSKELEVNGETDILERRDANGPWFVLVEEDPKPAKKKASSKKSKGEE